MCAYHKKTNRAFSHRMFSRLAGLKSSNFLKLVMDGKRNLSRNTVFKFAKALKLTRSETHFFEPLVFFGQARNVEEKNRYFERLTQFRSLCEIKTIEASQYDYFSNWYFVALRELVDHPDFSENPETINRKLGLKLKTHEVEQAIKTLLDLKVIERGANGRLKTADERLATSPDIADLAVINFQKEMIKKAEEALEQTPVAQRDISSLTVNLTREQFDHIRERLGQVRREIHAAVTASPQSKAVYQINFQMFNLTEVPWK